MTLYKLISCCLNVWQNWHNCVVAVQSTQASRQGLSNCPSTNTYVSNVDLTLILSIVLGVYGSDGGLKPPVNLETQLSINEYTQEPATNNSIPGHVPPKLVAEHVPRLKAFRTFANHWCECLQKLHMINHQPKSQAKFAKPSFWQPFANPGSENVLECMFTVLIRPDRCVSSMPKPRRITQTGTAREPLLCSVKSGNSGRLADLGANWQVGLDIAHSWAMS